MLATRSAVFKMTNKIQCDRSITSFPRPFLSCATPHKHADFSHLVHELPKLGPVDVNISKVIFVGDVAVGKTSLVNRFCHSLFESRYKATIGVDFEVERFSILDYKYNLQIWDTAGQERFKSIARSYYRGASAIVMVFSLCDYKSLEHTKTWLIEATKSIAGQPLLFIVGTKKDNISSSKYIQIETEAIKLANELNAEYWALSSKTGDCVNDFFKRLAALTFEQCVLRDFNEHSNKSNIGNPMNLKHIKDMEPKRNTCSSSCSKS